MQASSPIKSFFWKVLILLPICFIAWYFIAPALTIPLSYLSDWVLIALFPEHISAIEQHGKMLDIIIQFTPPSQQGVVVPEGQVAELVFSLNPLIYGYSMPLFAALVLSSPGKEKTKWIQLIGGFFVLLIAQLWGVGFDIFKTMLFNFPPEVSAQFNVGTYQKELVALGYQFGYLILPSVTPLVLWIGMYKDFLQELTLREK